MPGPCRRKRRNTGNASVTYEAQTRGSRDAGRPMGRGREKSVSSQTLRLCSVSGDKCNGPSPAFAF